jgi:hypothetical protein
MNIKQLTVIDDIQILEQRPACLSERSMNYRTALPSQKGEGGLGFLRTTMNSLFTER